MSTWITIASTDLDDYLVAAQATAIRTSALGSGQADTFTNVSQAVIENVRQQIRNNYNVSATAHSVPPEAKTNVCWLILAALQARLPGLKFTNEQKDMITEARAWLAKVAEGKFSVSDPADPEDPTDAQGAGDPYTIDRTLTHTRDDQDGI